MKMSSKKKSKSGQQPDVELPFREGLTRLLDGNAKVDDVKGYLSTLLELNEGRKSKHEKSKEDERKARDLLLAKCDVELVKKMLAVLATKQQRSDEKLDNVIALFNEMCPVLKMFSFVACSTCEVSNDEAWEKQSFYFPFTHTDSPTINDHAWSYVLKVFKDVGGDFANLVTALNDEVTEKTFKYIGAQSDEWKSLDSRKRFNITLFQMVALICEGKSVFCQHHPTLAHGWYPLFLWRENNKWRWIHEFNVVTYVRKKAISERESLATSFVARNIARKYDSGRQQYDYPKDVGAQWSRKNVWELDLFRNVLNCLKHAKVHKKSMGGLWGMLVVHLGFMLQMCLSDIDRKNFEQLANVEEKVGFLNAAAKEEDWSSAWMGQWGTVSAENKLFIAGLMRLPLYGSKIFLVPNVSFPKIDDVKIESSQLTFRPKEVGVNLTDLRMICRYLLGYFDVKIPMP